MVKYDVFVSYRWSDPDKTWVREELVPRLRAAGLQVCLDVEDFVPGRDLILEMERAGIQSRHILSVLSPAYFDGNRMVHFESLAARRRDPSGQTSSLIPLLLLDTNLPEWIRGLIPVDWTDERGHAREWRKLLTALGSDEDISPPPPAGSIGSSISRKQASPAKLELIDLIPLGARDKSGFGWDIVLANLSTSPVVVDQARLHGEHSVRVAGLMGETRKSEYEILLDARATADSARLDVLGTMFDDADAQWGRRCSGDLRHEFSTHAGHDTWTYSLTLPLYLSVPPADRHVIRLAFRNNTKSLTHHEQHGGTPMHSVLGLLKAVHKITFSKEGRAVLDLSVSPEFLQFLASLNVTSKTA